MNEDFLEKHYEEIYEEYCKRHPEEITSDFILGEDGNEDYIDEIIRDMKNFECFKEMAKDFSREDLLKKTYDVCNGLATLDTQSFSLGLKKCILEDIIKEAIEYIETYNFHCKNQAEQEKYDRDLLNILNKGREDNE